MAILSETDAIAVLNLQSTDTLLPLIVRHVDKLCKNFMGWDPERSAKTEYYESTERGGGSFYWLGEWGSYSDVGGRSDILQLKRKYVLASGLVVQEFAGAQMGQYTSTAWETLTLGEEYYLDLDNDNVSESGHLVRLGAQWPKSRGSVKVTYTAGFTATELSGKVTGAADYTDASDIQLAVILAVEKSYNEIKAYQRNPSGRAPGPITSESVPDYSYTADASAARTLLGMAADLPPAVQQILMRYSNRYSLVI